FDSQGNLWVADSLNNRVLRYPKSRLTGASEPAADLVLGHSTFDNEDAPTLNTQNDLLGLSRPSALAFDDKGGLYVADALLRVVYFDVQSTGGPAKRVLGIQPNPATGQVRPTAPTEYTLGQVGNQGVIPQCVFTLGSVLFVCDNAAHRIVRYGSPDTWPAPTNDTISPPQTGVYGQNNFRDSIINRGAGFSTPSNNSFYSPTSGAIFNNELWVADTGNNRVISIRQDGGAFNYTVANRVIGQIGYDLNAPNLVEGRELFISSSEFHGSAIAVDRNSSPNRLYISDSLNNRILGFKDVRKVGTDLRTLLTTQADVIIGQPDQFHTAINYPNNDPLLPSDQGLFTPTGIAVDAAGNLWVADTNNARVLRFPSPFNQPSGTPRRANLVLGQQNFTIKITDASTSTMGGPFGVAIFNNGDVAASDVAHNRILLWRKNGADFVNGQGARNVLGQQNFSTTAPSGSAAGLNNPRGLAVDGNDRLYVADTNNSRLIVYGNTGFITNGAAGTSIPGLGQVEGVAISVRSGEIWVASLNNN
ncbi:MAG: NHL repeat-containing protein, partial [Acidobacteriota bacterium]